MFYCKYTEDRIIKRRVKRFGNPRDFTTYAKNVFSEGKSFTKPQLFDSLFNPKFMSLNNDNILNSVIEVLKNGKVWQLNEKYYQYNGEYFICDSL